MSPTPALGEYDLARALRVHDHQCNACGGRCSQQKHPFRYDEATNTLWCEDCAQRVSWVYEVRQVDGYLVVGRMMPDGVFRAHRQGWFRVGMELAAQAWALRLNDDGGGQKNAPRQACGGPTGRGKERGLSVAALST